eukprot:GHRR01006051.1.p1 GENE.GHRR01006051.1~~GHRR01006051.1.p1  ORF type:complete len:375 (+),score=124.34 GHRR01006051.1:464-1588(+)
MVFSQVAVSNSYHRSKSIPKCALGLLLHILMAMSAASEAARKEQTTAIAPLSNIGERVVSPALTPPTYERIQAQMKIFDDFNSMHKYSDNVSSSGQQRHRWWQELVQSTSTAAEIAADDSLGLLGRRRRRRSSNGGRRSSNDDGSRSASDNRGLESGSNADAIVNSSSTTSSNAQKSQKASIVIMNWSRPNNTKDILRTYTTDPAYWPILSEVIVLHLRPESHFTFDHPLVKHVVDYEANSKYGLSVRMMGCLLAQETEVVLQDDDVLIQPWGLAHLLANRGSAAHPAQLVGYRGRDWDKSRTPRYHRSEPEPGHHPVALTIALITHKAVCAAFFKYAPAVEDLQHGSMPYWNGEYCSIAGLQQVYVLTHSKPS